MGSTRITSCLNLDTGEEKEIYHGSYISFALNENLEQEEEEKVLKEIKKIWKLFSYNISSPSKVTCQVIEDGEEIWVIENHHQEDKTSPCGRFIYIEEEEKILINCQGL